MLRVSRLRLVAINDVYELTNLPKLASLLSSLTPHPCAVLLAGDFLSPSTLSSIDGGRGMVATLRAAGISHFCLGNHEADLPLPVIKDRVEEFSRSAKFVNTNLRRPPESALWMKDPELSSEYAVVYSPDEQIRVALLGLMSDEEAVFRNGTFRGIPIDNVLDTFSSMHAKLVPSVADLVIPMTHQSIGRDQTLAHHMLGIAGSNGLIVGGHEHIAIDQTVTSADSDSDASVRVLKSGSDAQHASVIDLSFDVSQKPAVLKQVEATLVDLGEYQDSVVVKKIADSHLSVVENMENAIVVECSNLPPGQVLSSERSRFQQTTVGSYFCQSIKEELEVDVALINGGTIKGDTTYLDSKMSYSQLKKELPFPTKIVVVEMTRGRLQNAIHFSRTHVEEGAEPNGEGEIERRGYLQVDLDFDLEPHKGDHDDVLKVALPRNLMAGFCKIQPLIDHGEYLKQQGLFPDADDFIPALDLIVRHGCKNKWFEIVHQQISFEELDLNHDGVLDRYEVKKMMEKYLGHEPPDFVVDNMIAAIDTDENGVIDVGELSYLLATMEREEQWRKF